jgi:aryl-alcohol dehydrogenase-like predicted oxidoreductase
MARRETEYSMAGRSRLRDLLGSELRVGLGGEGVLRTNGRGEEASKMLDAAYEGGIRYFDSAPAYAGSEDYLGHFFAKYPERKGETFQTSKSARRSTAGAKEDLERSLSRLGRNRLDLWQMHDLRDRDDLRLLSEGALRTFTDARETGMVRGIGVTGHSDPEVLLSAVTSWDIDSVLLPVSPVETALGGFSDRVIPAARERGIGVIGMKVLGAGNFLYPKSGLTAENLIRFALSQDVDLVIVGCSTPAEAGLLARLARDPAPLDEDEQERLVRTVRPLAERLASYREVV